MNLSLSRHHAWPSLTRGDGRRYGWLSDAILSGFVATFAMTVALAAGFGVGRAIGDRDGWLVARWFWSLTHAPMTRTTADGWAWVIAFHLLMGMVWAVVYARAAESVPAAAGWRAGMLFATIPWALSVVVFLPVVGGGVLGRRIDAGPLPVLGNLILHLVYGGVLGAVYAVAREEEHDDTVDRVAMAGAERGAAIGIVLGLVVGAGLGWAAGPGFSDLADRGMVTLAGALTGMALGVLPGSLIGMGRPPDRALPGEP